MKIVKKKYIVAVVVIILIALYFVVTLSNKIHSPDVIIRNTGDATLSCVVYVPGTNYKVDVFPGSTVRLKTIVKRPGSIELKVNDSKYRKTLIWHCGVNTKATITVILGKSESVTVSYKSSFEWRPFYK